ncbi:MAG: outer membrane protein [Alteromonadaceae bacterium]|jgi:outer membrane protein
MLNKAAKNVALVLLGSLMMLGNASAKDQKVGLVDFQFIAQQLPQMAAIDQKVRGEFKEQIEAIDKLRSDAKYNYDKLQREGATLSTDQQAELKKTIVEQQRNLEAQGKPLQQQMQRRSAEEQNKIVALIEQAIKQIAKDDGYDMVLHKNSVAFLTDDDNADISAKVAERVKKIK